MTDAKVPTTTQPSTLEEKKFKFYRRASIAGLFIGLLVVLMLFFNLATINSIDEKLKDLKYLDSDEQLENINYTLYKTNDEIHTLRDIIDEEFNL